MGNDVLHIFGCFYELNGSNDFLTSSKMYNIKLYTWSKGHQLPVTLVHPVAAVESDNTFALVLGFNSNDVNISLIIFDKLNGFRVFSQLPLRNVLKPIIEFSKI